MLFTEPLFLFYFLPVYLGLHALLVRSNHGKEYGARLLVYTFVASLVSYAYKETWYLLPFFFCIGCDFLWATLLDRTVSERRRKLILFFAVSQSLLTFALFKYLPFLQSLVEKGAPSLLPFFPRLSENGATLPLPPGISFYTFESMSFVIDVYRRTVTRPATPLKFFGFIGMFPRFIAGPIVRYRDMIDQIENYGGMRIERGLPIFVQGLLTKAVLADNFAVFVDTAFPKSGSMDFFSAWILSFAYSMQIYLDFSGYSLMAIGLGLCMGFEFPKNFDRPYLATSLRDFWRRWHISLSTWFRDYVYIPLGGAKGSQFATYRNLAATMILSGAWHGAGFNYILWGVWHAFFLSLERALNLEGRLPRKGHGLLTFLVVVGGFGIFRTTSGNTALNLVRSLVGLGRVDVVLNYSGFLVYPLSSAVCLVGIFYVFAFEGRKYWVEPLQVFETGMGRAALVFSMLAISVFLLMSAPSIPFIYFQF